MHTHEKQLYDMKEVNYHQNDFDTSYAKYIYISSNGIASIFKAEYIKFNTIVVVTEMLTCFCFVNRHQIHVHDVAKKTQGQ